MYLFQEIECASQLLAQNNRAKRQKTFNGRISPEAEKRVKDFLQQAKVMLQKLNLHATGRDIYRDSTDAEFRRHNRVNKDCKRQAKKTLYIKNFFYNIKTKSLILYTRLHGEDKTLHVAHIGQGVYSVNSTCGDKLTGRIGQVISSIMSYWIPSESSMDNIKAISLVGSYR